MTRPIPKARWPAILTVALVIFTLLPTPILSARSSSSSSNDYGGLRVKLSKDHSKYDGGDPDLNTPELAASAVSPFCKSFTFLCHIRCMQRGDPTDAGNDNYNPNNYYGRLGNSEQLPQQQKQRQMQSRFAGRGEINRCSHVPKKHAVHVLCICNNGVDLTAEIDYALEGIVDIVATGDNDSNENGGDATGGRGNSVKEGGDISGWDPAKDAPIRTLLYRGKTVTETVQVTVVDIQTVSVPYTVWQTTTQIATFQLPPETVVSTVTVAAATPLPLSPTTDESAPTLAIDHTLSPVSPSTIDPGPSLIVDPPPSAFFNTLSPTPSPTAPTTTLVTDVALDNSDSAKDIEGSAQIKKEGNVVDSVKGEELVGESDDANVSENIPTDRTALEAESADTKSNTDIGNTVVLDDMPLQTTLPLPSTLEVGAKVATATAAVGQGPEIPDLKEEAGKESKANKANLEETPSSNDEGSLDNKEQTLEGSEPSVREKTSSASIEQVSIDFVKRNDQYGENTIAKAIRDCSTVASADMATSDTKSYKRLNSNSINISAEAYCAAFVKVCPTACQALGRRSLTNDNMNSPMDDVNRMNNDADKSDDNDNAHNLPWSADCSWRSKGQEETLRLACRCGAMEDLTGSCVSIRLLDSAVAGALNDASLHKVLQARHISSQQQQNQQQQKQQKQEQQEQHDSETSYEKAMYSTTISPFSSTLSLSSGTVSTDGIVDIMDQQRELEGRLAEEHTSTCEQFTVLCDATCHALFDATPFSKLQAVVTEEQPAASASAQNVEVQQEDQSVTSNKGRSRGSQRSFKKRSIIQHQGQRHRHRHHRRQLWLDDITVVSQQAMVKVACAPPPQQHHQCSCLPAADVADVGKKRVPLDLTNIILGIVA
ncbi:hypothetical protein BGW42_005616 [Actinomortierella wolfii]|nr:hypothetical protein BGW42_005616 [Actinomortierella wolfii]